MISNLTKGQKEVLLESLTYQKSRKTTGEQRMLNLLRDHFSFKLTCEVDGFKRCGDFVKQIHMDSFGDHYRNSWIKIQKNTKGEFFYSSYIGKRIYIN